MAGERAPLVGTWGKVWLDGEDVAKFSSITASVQNNYAEYYEGLDLKRTKVSHQGTGTATIQEVYSTCASILQKYLAKGEEPHFVIETNLKDPGAANGQQEGYTINEVSFDEVPFLAMTKGEIIEKDLNFAFPPSKVQVNDQVFNEA